MHFLENFDNYVFLQKMWFLTKNGVFWVKKGLICALGAKKTLKNAIFFEKSQKITKNHDFSRFLKIGSFLSHFWPKKGGNWAIKAKKPQKKRKNRKPRIQKLQFLKNAVFAVFSQKSWFSLFLKASKNPTF